jgi:hypothetical protein
MGVGEWDRARIQCPCADERRFARSHCGGDTCLGADGCDIGRKPERARAAGEVGAHGCRRGASGYGGKGYK